MIKAIKSIGTSMSPFIKDEDIVLYEEFKSPLSPFLEKGGNPPLNPPRRNVGREERGILRPGDMVVYKINDEIYIHRIVSIENGKFIISNDDDLEKHIIEKEQILGRVVSIYNGFFGYLIHIFLRTMRKVLRKAKE
jgi:signal peptidase I